MYLAKLNQLSVLKSLYRQVTIPSAVYKEAVHVGKREGHLEAQIIERAIEGGWIRVRKVKRNPELQNFAELDTGEIETLSLARQLKASIVLIDDASARLVAEVLGHNSKGTLYVILRAANEGITPKTEAKRLLTELISMGFWLSSEILARVFTELD